MPKLLAALIVVGLASLACPAPAQTFGPPIQGVCVFDRRAALDRSQAGVSANQQIAQFAQGIRAELGAQRAAIVADDRALAARKGATPAAQYQEAVAQLRQRYQALDQTAKTRDAQLRRTSDAAAELIGKAMGPALDVVLTEHRCALVVERADLYGANPAMDITAPVIQAINARLPLISLRLAPAGPTPAS
ncbi:MAG: OmpH family outer membrane protein [Caulobacteraceae bacterium]